MTTGNIVMNRGEVWNVDFNPVRGHEQGGKRPAVILSADVFNHGPAGNIIVVPVTSRNKRNPLHVILMPPEGGARMISYIKCEDIRAISKERCEKKLGALETATLMEVEEIVRTVLSL